MKFDFFYKQKLFKGQILLEIILQNLRYHDISKKAKVINFRKGVEL